MIRTLAAIALLVLAGSPSFGHEGTDAQIAEVSRRIAGEPENARLYLQRGELYRIHGDRAHALEDYSSAEKLDRDLSAVDLGRARIYFEDQRYWEAKRFLDRLVRNEPENAEGAILRARSLAKLGSIAAAVREWERAHRLTQNPTPEFYLEWSRVVGDDGRAIAVLDAGIARLGPVVTLELAAVDLELRRQNHDAALQRIALLAKQSPRKESWLARRGEILLAASRKAEACRAFDEAMRSLEALPDSRRQTRAMSYLQQRIATGLSTCSD